VDLKVYRNAIYSFDGPDIADSDLWLCSVDSESMMLKEDYVVLATFRKSLRRFLRFVEVGALEAGITPQQHQVLLAIKGQPDRDYASITELADSLQLKHHAMVGLVDRCQAAGLVERSADFNDRRCVRVMLTAKGDEILTLLTQRNVGELRKIGRLAADLQTLAQASDGFAD